MLGVFAGLPLWMPWPAAAESGYMLNFKAVHVLAKHTGCALVTQ